MDSQLIYDVGVHVGEDTAFYLARGYRVVGIEADPILAKQLRERFSSDIAKGTLVLLNVGVGECEGEADFWVSERPLWSSFNKEMACRDGLSCYKVKVPTRTLQAIFDDQGVPFYCKIDVEGYDMICVESLQLGRVPSYLSMELDAPQGVDNLRRLQALGYSKFKVISQVTRAQPSRPLMSLACRLPYRGAEYLRGAERNLRGVTSVDGWRFGGLSSGPFADETPGRWRSYEDTLGLVSYLANIEARREQKGLHDWFDIHAVSECAAAELA